MREIIFRGKRLDNGEWVEGDLIQLSDGRRYIVNNIHGACIDDKGNFINTEEPFVCRVDPETVGQYTGLKDKNGKQIFERDIVVDADGTIYPVVWGGTGFYLKYDPPYAHGYHYDLLPLCNYWHAHGAIIEIIGNIHDNPELIGGAE